MLQAQLKGKLTRDEERMEDLLTSSVFGSLEYLPLASGLTSVLAEATDGEGTKPLMSLTPISGVEFRFWPWLEEKGCVGCEPDVLIRISHVDGSKTIILIEAKFLSGKSSVATTDERPTDQLAREWDNLRLIARSEGASPVLLYVTADMTFPIESVSEACSEFRIKRAADIAVLWISWRQLPGCLSDIDSPIARDVVRLLERLSLTYYQGVVDPGLFTHGWEFVHRHSIWAWAQYEPHCLPWSFSLHSSFSWSHEASPIRWRYAL